MQSKPYRNWVRGALGLTYLQKGLATGNTVPAEDPGIVCMVRELQNFILHRPAQDLTDLEVTRYLQYITAILENKQNSRLYPAVKSALKKLKEILNDELIITLSEEAEVIQNALDDITAAKEQTEENLRKIAQEKQSAIKAFEERIRKLEKENENTFKASEESIKEITEEGRDALQQQTSEIMTVKKQATEHMTFPVYKVVKDTYEPEIKIHYIYLRHSSHESSSKTVEIDQHSLQLGLEMQVASLQLTEKKLRERTEYLEKKKELQVYLVDVYQEHYVNTSISPLLRTKRNAVNIGDVYVSPNMVVEEKEDGNNENTSIFGNGSKTKSKHIESYRDIFGTREKRNTKIFIVGDVGTGKSSFCKMMVQNWCRSISAIAKRRKSYESGVTEEDKDDIVQEEGYDMCDMNRFDFLFYISLCRMTEPIDDIADMVKSQLKYDRTLLDELFTHDSERSLFLVDGLDEWTPPPSQLRVTAWMPTSVSARDSTIITTSRPSCRAISNMTSSEYDLKVTLLGLKESSVQPMVEKYMKSFHDTSALKDFDNTLSKLKVRDIQNAPRLLQQIIWLHCNNFDLDNVLFSHASEAYHCLKNGIQTFIETTVQDQHKQLCDDVFENSEYKRKCSMCDKNNLLPKHSNVFCPSQKGCLCKKKSKDRRPCPNGICDSLLEEIFRAHRTSSPNLKNTNICRWYEDYWELAKCFMAHDSDSIENTDLMDLLHIMANDKLIRKKLGLPESNICVQTDDYLNEVIQACKTIRRQRMIDPQTYVESYHKDMMRLLEAVGDDNAKYAAYQLEEVLKMIVLTEKMLQKPEVDGKDDIPVSKVDLELLKSSKEREAGARSIAENYSELTVKEFLNKLTGILVEHLTTADYVLKHTHTRDCIQLDFVQRAKVVIDPGTVSDINELPNGSLVETTALKEIFGKANDGNVCKDILALYSNTDERDWFIDNILRSKFNFNDDPCTSSPAFQDVLVLTLPFAQKLGVPVHEFCETASKALETQENSIIVADLSHESIEKNLILFEKFVKQHTLVRLVHKSHTGKYWENVKTVVLLGGIKELVLSGCKSEYSHKTSEGIKQCLNRCFRKIGPRTLERLTLKNLVFDEGTAKVDLSFIDSLKTIKLNASKLVPVANLVRHLELENVSFTTSETVTLCDSMRGIQSVTFLGQTRYVLENIKNLLVWQSCPQLENISTLETTIGQNKDVNLDVQKNDFDQNCSACFGKSSSSCTADELSCMMHHAINKQMLNTFTRDDFEEAKSQIEKQFILDAVCYSLLQKHQSYEDVYPARYKNLGETFLVCLTKDDKFMSVQRNPSGKEDPIPGEYVGFKTIEKNAFPFSTIASYLSTADFDEAIKKYHTFHFDNVNEIVAFHAERLLTEHRNLVSVAVCLGKATTKGVDLNFGPHIVLYVKAKSYIPVDDQPFPKELVHDKAIDIKYPVDVREGYYVSLADAAPNLHAKDKLQTLAMGCSIGPESIDFGGTMGPLVEYKLTGPNQPFLGFLTACHLFRRPERFIQAVGINVVQPADSDEAVNTNTSIRLTTPNKICGQVVACEFNEEIDAALVRIDDRAPASSQFITPTYEDIKQTGFSLFGNDGLPNYQNGHSLRVSDLTVQNGNVDKRIVKFGKATGLKRGMLALNSTAVSLSETVLPGLCPENLQRGVQYKHKLTRQIQVFSPPEFSFFQKGDSGCGVFLVDNENKLWCIGMGVGMLSGSICVVTPIHAILEGLQSYLGNGSELRLKSFEPDEMIA